MTEIDRYQSSTGNIISLTTDGVQWHVVNSDKQGAVIWTEAYSSGKQPFTEEEARTEFERWRV